MESSYQNFKVWNKSMELVSFVYQASKNFPTNEKFGLTNQIRRCAVSIPSNIAEGSQRETDKDFYHFLRMAKGSSAELETQWLIANKLGYIKNKEQFNKILDLLIEVRKMLSGLKASLKISS